MIGAAWTRLRGRALAVWRTLVPTPAEWRAALPAMGLSLLSAVLLRLAYWPYFLSPLAFVALVPLFWGLRGRRPVMAFWVAWIFGTAMGLVGTGWFVVVDRFNSLVWFGILPLGMYVGFWFALAAALIVALARRLDPWLALPAGAAAWAGVEYFFGIGPLGMPYGVGQALGGWTTMALVASLGGLHLLSFLLLASNLSVMETVSAFRGGYGHAGALARLVVVAAALAGAWAYGNGELTRRQQPPENPLAVRLALTQSNIPQEEKYASYTHPDYDEALRLQHDLAVRQLDQLRTIPRDAVDLVVTPESTFTMDSVDVEASIQERLYGRPVFLEVADIARDLRAPIIVGGIDNTFRNDRGETTEFLRDALYIDENGQTALLPGHAPYGGLWIIRPETREIPMVADYRKVQLMPFGETVPYLSIIPGFQEAIVQVGTFARGQLGEPLGIALDRVPGQQPATLRLGPSVCFEDQFAWIHTHYARRGANLFVNTTNDGWFEGSPGPHWHAEMARWRSIETAIPMVRSTNTGITCLIDATGRITESLPPTEMDILYLDITLDPDPEPTIYARTGNLVGILCFLATIGLVAWLRFAPQPGRRSNATKESVTA